VFAWANAKEIRMPPKIAKRKTVKPAASQSKKETSTKQDTGAVTTTDAVEQKLGALAEQMGRLIGTVQTKAEGWLDPKYMRDQITRIQDGAADLLSYLGTGRSAEPAPQPARPSRGRSGGKVDAPGKKHRPPPPSTRTPKPSDDRVATLKAANRSIRRPRQG
jgi:hypothetical protein